MTWRSIFTPIAEFWADPAPSEGAADCSVYERFALPFKFQPQLKVSHAFAFALQGLLRIFLGSILFGAWGAYTLLAWTSIPNLFLRTAIMVPMLALFLALLAALMVVTSRMTPRRLPR